MVHVVNKFIVELETQLADKKVELHMDDSAREWLAEHGYDKTMGARPMARLIKEKIKKELANALLFGDLVDGGSVSISVSDGKLTFNIQSKQEEIAEVAS